MFHSTLGFLKAVGKHWWNLLSCAVFTIIGVIAAVMHSNLWIVWVSSVAAFILLQVASFLAWKDEHEKFEQQFRDAEIERKKARSDA